MQAHVIVTLGADQTQGVHCTLAALSSSWSSWSLLGHTVVVNHLGQDYSSCHRQSGLQQETVGSEVTATDSECERQVGSIPLWGRHQIKE